MGQLALGLRSLFVRLAIFVVMAALLAWALGGTLFPRAETAEYDAVSLEDRSWFWRLSVGGRRVPELDPLGVQWELMVREGDRRARRAVDRSWVDVAGPVVAGDAVIVAGRPASDAGTPWDVAQVVSGDEDAAWALEAIVTLDSRLEVEVLLAQLAAGRTFASDAEVRESVRQAVATLTAPADGPESAD